ncbi:MULTISPECIES: HIT family protein [unclassified Streptomyces]|uniref:HIT family protein n=1 Tax=unclassified Streptomyces TaxID=2593676 RepID=UPI002DD95AA7|nr:MULTISPECIES: HIT family protein [unclassified Streptomyces]WSA91032.1 HIT family protein [Streptomyces sp. NBC_01795]WSB75357.1 HIT family protein [Streptomyces sp. NBC_01775]WSS16361.1 HIT family protein [Streptomyces sp. NBC_01186]WSS45178.1 HIT family protein [Streptomyces sp. NBC_01187]
MECVFCKIIDGEQSAHRIYEDGAVVAFLDRRPLFSGHTLVVPRAHVETLTDLPEESTGPYFSAVRRVTGAVERGMAADGSFVATNNKVSQSVPHLHVHVVPRRKKDGLRGFFWPRNPYTDETEARRVAARIRAQF